MSHLETLIRATQITKAEKAFEDGIAVYGSVEARLRSLDCKTKREAVLMLAVVQPYSVCKVNGVICVL